MTLLIGDTFCPHHYCRTDAFGHRYCCLCGQPATHPVDLTLNGTTAANRVSHWHMGW